VVTATGGWDTMLRRGKLPDAAPALPSIYLMLPLTLALARGETPPIGRRAVIIGGGKKALGLARQLKQRGAEQVTILWRRDQERIGVGKEDLARAREEGVTARAGVRVSRLLGQGDRLRELAYTDQRMRQRGESGERVIEVDTVVAASGRLPEMIFVPLGAEEEGVSPDRWQTVLPYRDPSVSPRGRFDAAEPVGDYRAAVEALAAGRRAAASAHRAVMGREVAPPEFMLTPHSRVPDVGGLEHLLDAPPQQSFPRLDQDAELLPAGPGEALSEEAVKAEARRCLNCGLICYYRTQYH
jgi:NADPH-dependent glutamate synthase beta subunit-like oxidoreductase